MTIEALRLELEKEKAARVAAEAKVARQEKLLKELRKRGKTMVAEPTVDGQHKNMEHQLEAQRKFYEQVLNEIPADIAVFSSDHRYLYLNKVAISKPELRKWIIGKNDEEYCAYTNKPMSLARDRRALFNSVKESGKQKEWEERMVRPDGTVEYHLRKMYPVLDEKGNVEIVIGYGVNITERKKFEEQIKLSEARYREIFSFSQAWICTHDMQGRLLTVNPSICKGIGYNEQELLGMTIGDLVPIKVRDQFSQAYLPAIKAEGKAEGVMSILSKSGKNLYLLYQNYLVQEPGSEPYVIGFAQNITERVHAEEALKRSEEKYRSIIENMNLGMMETDTEGNIQSVNQSFCTMSGYGQNDLMGRKAFSLFKINKNERAAKEQLGITNSFECTVKNRNGENKWWLISTAPLFHTDGTIKGTIGIYLDITQQKQLEKQLREAKQEAERSSYSKEIFLANMSHEIRTPMNAIMGLGKLLQKSTLSNQQKYYLNSIQTASENLLVIINDILDFSKIEAGKITLERIGFNLSDVVKHSMQVFTHKAEEKGLILDWHVDSDIAPVLMSDPFRINQVLMNMLGNAIKFTEKGTVRIEASLLNEIQNKQEILINIRDTGIGMNEEFLRHLFEKFTQEDETIARKFGGTGLGMSISKQLVELMGGRLVVKSRKNEGTTISIIFRFDKGSGNDLIKKEEIQRDTKVLQGKRILLVEDNEMNRLVATTVLQQYGADICEAENGLVAIHKMQQNEFDLVLMDIQMPVKDGIETTRHIRKEIDTAIPIIALTANAIKGEEEKCIGAGMNDFISKPFDEDKMVQRVAKWLGKDVNMVLHTSEEQSAIKPLYDLSKLRAIGDDDFVRKMLQLFIKEIPTSLGQIETAYANHDLDTVRAVVHRIKPAILNMGIVSLKDDMVQMEEIARAGYRTDELGNLVDRLGMTIRKVVDQVKDEL